MPAETGGDWARTSPTAIVIFFGRALRNLVTHGAPALVPLAATFAAVDGLRWYWLAAPILQSTTACQVMANDTTSNSQHCAAGCAKRAILRTFT